VEIYSTRDTAGRQLSVHKERVAPGEHAYFIDVSTPSGDGQCWALSGGSMVALHALLADALKPTHAISRPFSSNPAE
jgi:hypothetical protein